MSTEKDSMLRVRLTQRQSYELDSIMCNSNRMVYSNNLSYKKRPKIWANKIININSINL